MGKVEENFTRPQATPGDALEALPWHGHITALTVAPSMRRTGLGTLLTNAFENQCNLEKALFIDLFVRESNKTAIKMYERLGYSVYRVVQDYYPGLDDEQSTEHALDMRKLLKHGESREELIRSNGRDHIVQPWAVW
jgi:N-terminal acetyltransferase B complex catalytic subunit